MRDSYTLTITFATDTGRTTNLIIHDADPAADLAAIQDAATEIIGANVLTSRNGIPAEAVRAVMARREFREIVVS